MTPSNSPPISVLMPVYNAAPYLREALDSVLAQTFEDFEFIVVNDGSSDGSLEIIQEYAAKDERIRVVSRPNTGIVGALNDGLELVRGEFIARMDADDVAKRERFARQVAFMRENIDVVASGCRCLVVDEDDDPINLWGYILEHDAIEQKLMKGIVSVLHHSSAMFRHDAVREIGGYRSDAGVSEDLDLYLRLAEKGRLSNVPEMLMAIRRHPESISASRTPEQQAETRTKCVTAALNRRGQDSQAVELSFNATADSPYQSYSRRVAGASKSGFARAARKYAWRAFRIAPFRRESWKLLRKAYTCRLPDPTTTAWWNLHRSNST